jgi:hypothetical protein
VCMRFLLPPQELAAVDKAGEVHSSRPVVILGPLSWSARWGKVVVPPIWRATCQKLRSKLLSGIGGGCALCLMERTVGEGCGATNLASNLSEAPVEIIVRYRWRLCIVSNYINHILLCSEFIFTHPVPSAAYGPGTRVRSDGAHSNSHDHAPLSTLFIHLARWEKMEVPYVCMLWYV